MNVTDHNNQVRVETTFLDRILQMPIELAPNQLTEAIDKWREASEAYDEAQRKADNAPDDVEEAEIAWKIAAEAAVRANKPLPTKTDIERAQIAERIAVHDTVAPRAAAQTARHGVLYAIRNTEIRNQWRESIAAKASGLQKKLEEVTAKISPTVGEIESLIGITHFLGNYPRQHDIPYSTGSSVNAPLRAVIALTPWTPPTPKLDPGVVTSIDPTAHRGTTIAHV